MRILEFPDITVSNSSVLIEGCEVSYQSFADFIIYHLWCTALTESIGKILQVTIVLRLFLICIAVVNWTLLALNGAIIFVRGKIILSLKVSFLYSRL